MRAQQNTQKRTGLVLATVVVLAGAAAPATGQDFVVVDTGQTACYNERGTEITCPATGQAFSGQDAQHAGAQPSYRDNGDGTVSDLNTGLMWQKTPLIGLTYDEAVAQAASVNTSGYSDWRLPTIKELYSLIDFSGVTGTSAANSTPYVDTGYFDFEYGDTASGDRFIDAQYCSSTTYVSTTMDGNPTVFGVNFADGRIKGYGTETPRGAKTFHVRYVRGGNPAYGSNDLVDNGDGTITDRATGLMWSQADSGVGMPWEQALAWVAAKNAESYLGHDDWCLPDAKRLQSIVDYSRSPDTTASAAIDPLFTTTAIINEGGETDYPFFWTSTTHLDGPADIRGSTAAYVAFGRALGFMESPPDSGNYQLMDVHGAGAQRSDPKEGDASEFPYGHGPQGDVIRINNHVRLVRTADLSGSSAPEASFSLSPDEPVVGQSVQLTDTSTGNVTAWSWDFDDGSGSDVQNPSHAWTTAGARTVTLTVSNSVGSDTASRTITVLEPDGCVADGNALCLAGDRFRVEVAWEDGRGAGGSGRPVPLTDETGCFWFFNGQNLELMVKVVDGRNLNDHFWFFYGALTNVEYTIVVTDTLTGAANTYLSPFGNFASEGDTTAFYAP